MKTYEYQILRYCHDIVTGEFINVGIVAYDPKEKELRAKMLRRYKRLSDFFHGVDGKNILLTLRFIELSLKKLNNEIKEKLDFESMTSVEAITSSVLPKDDSALKFSKVYKGLTLDIDHTLEELYSTFIMKYESHSEKKSRTDEEAWREVYKKYFDSKGITEKLQPNTVKTRNDEFRFDLSWKNGKWNFFKPLSFDLVEDENIKSKVYRWAGITQELLTATEPFNLYYLALEPEKRTDDIDDFIERKLKMTDNGHTVKIIKESEAESFVSELKHLMEIHEG
ncbi:MAG TPA: DUF3037 domain-containing protein [Ignavibacteriales bacterium]|nr:DUF3037 domain-containing protein [Ignavibacteriales bacterium]